MSRCACIDIGTNTTRLLVAEQDGGGLVELAADRAFTLLVALDAGDGTIGSSKIEEVAAVVARQARQARELGVESLRVVATAAVRTALDKVALAAAIDAACGLRLEILSADVEARLAFVGAIGMLTAPPAGRLAVVDVGGGSTELAVGTAEVGVTWSLSLPTGSLVLTRAELHSDPPARAELTRAMARLEEVFATVQAPPADLAYAVGGSATSLQGLVGTELGRDALAGGLRALVSGPTTEVAERLGLHPARVRLLPAAILLLDAASRALGLAPRLAGGGVREGVILEQIAAHDEL